MGIKALGRHGYLDTARTMSTNLIRQMEITYREVTPHTIWETYSPTANEPSTKKDNKNLVRKDFCGWSALGPISLLIENVLGFDAIDATARTVRWTKSRTDRHGIRQLRFGPVTTDILADGDMISVQSDGDYPLTVNGRTFAITAGAQTLQLA